MSEAIRQVIIIGSGPAGYTAAIYAARANLRPMVYAGSAWGGQLMLTTDLENFPGFPDGIEGAALMERMRAQAERFGAEMRDCDVTSVDLTHHPFTVIAGTETTRARAVIVATGAQAKALDVPGEEEYRGRGVCTCATCDGALFAGRRVVVVGGGDVAVEEALLLARLSCAVTLIHRRDQLRASKALAQRALDHPAIQFMWETVVEEIIGEPDAKTGISQVAAVRAHHIASGVTTHLATDAVFVAVGHTPNTELIREHLPLDEHGYARARAAETTATAVEGVFVAGDVRDHHYRQAVTAAADGCRAAIDAERWLDATGRSSQYSTHLLPQRKDAAREYEVSV
jgi:thioredoxin reductase (NADPH)